MSSMYNARKNYKSLRNTSNSTIKAQLLTIMHEV